MLISGPLKQGKFPKTVKAPQLPMFPKKLKLDTDIPFTILEGKSLIFIISYLTYPNYA